VDPYIVCALGPGEEEQTSALDQELSPYWNESLEFDFEVRWITPRPPAAASAIGSVCLPAVRGA
jgi:hypothetical protein